MLKYSDTTNFRQELIEPSAIKVLFFLLSGRERRAGGGRASKEGEENMAPT